MSVFNGKAESSRKYWSFNPENENYRVELTGDIVEMGTRGAFIFGTNEPDYWDNGDKGKRRKEDCYLVLQDADGEEWTWVYKPGSKARPSNALMACRNAVPDGDAEKLLGKNVTISTVAPPKGFSYGAGNPRPFKVVVNGPGQAEVRGMFLYSENQQGQAKAEKVADADEVAAFAQQYRQSQRGADVSVYEEDIPF